MLIVTLVLIFCVTKDLVLYDNAFSSPIAEGRRQLFVLILFCCAVCDFSAVVAYCGCRLKQCIRTSKYIISLFDIHLPYRSTCGVSIADEQIIQMKIMCICTVHLKGKGLDKSKVLD